MTTWGYGGNYSPNDMTIGDLYVTDDGDTVVILTKHVMSISEDAEPTVSMMILKNSKIEFLILPVWLNAGVNKS